MSRGSFDCGSDSLNEYFRRHARQNDVAGIATCFVALDKDGMPKGYYAYSMAELVKSSLPAESAKGIPGYPIGAIRIGRLARDKSVRGQGMGDQLLKDCLKRIVALSENPSAPAFKFILVDAVDNNASRFYQKFGFIPFTDKPNTLFLPLDTVINAKT